MVVSLKLNKGFECKYGIIENVTPLIRRIVAPNPGPFTFKGTGTYIIGRDRVAIIDPGPLMEDHVDAILHNLEKEEITHQLITHTHLDHSPASSLVKQRTGAVTCGFGPHGTRNNLKKLRAEEGGDLKFKPDKLLKDGEIVQGDGWTIECIHTPGHTSNHLCFALKEENSLFSGDHVMGWSTTVISPPDGHMGAYLRSLANLKARSEEVYYPTHGAPIFNGRKFIRGLIAHRKMREGQIISLIKKGHLTIMSLVDNIYVNLDPRLIGAAKLSIFAHIIDLNERGITSCKGKMSIDSEYFLI